MKSDPQFEMRNLLKKKKVNILKNYKINVKNPKLFDEYASMDIEKHFKTQENEEEVDGHSVKMTAAFGNELKYSSQSKMQYEMSELGSEKMKTNGKNHIKTEKNNPYSIYNDDFANKFIETDNSDINFLSENLKENKNKDKNLKKQPNLNDSQRTKEDNLNEDPNLEKLKKSLDSYSKMNQNYKMNTIGTTQRSEIDTGRFTQANNKLGEKELPNSNKDRSVKNTVKQDREESDIFDFNVNISKEQLQNKKNDVSDTVNVYEKIFKEIKKESKSEKESNPYKSSFIDNNKTNNNTEKDIVNYNYDTKSVISERHINSTNKNNLDSSKKTSEKQNSEKGILNNNDKYKTENISKKRDIPLDSKPKEDNRKPIPTEHSAKNVNAQGESVIFLNNLDYEKEGFKDLNNFFSPQSRLDEVNNQNQINQSNLSSFNNHINTQHAPINNLGSILTDSKLKAKNNYSESVNFPKNKEDIKRSEFNGTSLDDISQNNILDYFDYKSKMLNNIDSENKINDNLNLETKLNKEDFNNSLEYSKKESLFNNIDTILNQSQNSKKNNKRNDEINQANKKIESSFEKRSIKEQNEDKLKKLHEILESGEDLPKLDNKSISNKVIDYGDYYKYDINNPSLTYTNINNTNTAEILNMALELKEAKKTIISMKDIIDELKKESKAKEETYKKQTEDKLSVQKFEFEKHLEKQKGFIENILVEKKKITATVTELSEKLDIAEKSGQKKVSQMLENFELELKKNKDAWFQAEKMRRKKWEEAKIKEIKEMTIKGMEPDFQRILERNKHEIQMIEDKALNDQRKLREKLSEEFEKKLNEAKERFTKEKEEALEHERNLASQRLRNQSERLEEENGEERRRWNAKIQDEVQRLEKLRENDKKIYEDQIVKIEERNLKLLDEKENFYKLKINEMDKRFDDKIQSEQSELLLKFAKEKEKFTEEKRKEYEQKFKETKHELIKDRDKQLQLVIDKLGEETLNEKKKMLMECEVKADIINKQLRQENDVMSKKIQEISDKLGAETKVRLMLDSNLDSLSRKLQDKETLMTKKESQILELTAKYNEVTDKYSNIAREFSKEKIDVEHDYKSKLQKFESEMKLLTEKNNTLKIQYNNKLKESQKEYETEIIKIEEKIKNSISKKDDIIKKLQEESHVKEITIKKLEELLAKQRMELLMNN